MLKSLFKKKPREEEIEKRVCDVFTELVKAVEIEFTELETVQIVNSVRRKTHEYLSEKHSHCMEQSVHFQQRAAEIKSALELIE